jgi:hypothetical protein
LKILKIEIIKDEDLPPEIRAKFGLPPVPAKQRAAVDVDFYEHRRYLERKKLKKNSKS